MRALWWMALGGAGCTIVVNPKDDPSEPTAPTGGGGGTTSPTTDTDSWTTTTTDPTDPPTTPTSDAYPCGDGCDWSMEVIDDLKDTLLPPYSEWDAAIAPDGTVHVVLFDSGPNEIRYVSSNGWAGELVMDMPPLQQAGWQDCDVDVDVGADGVAHLAYNVAVDLYGTTECWYTRVDGSWLHSEVVVEMGFADYAQVEADLAGNPQMLCGWNGLYVWDGAEWIENPGSPGGRVAETSTIDPISGWFVFATDSELLAYTPGGWVIEDLLPGVELDVDSLEILPDGSIHVGAEELSGDSSYEVQSVVHLTDASGVWEVEVLDDFGTPAHAALAQDSSGRLHAAWLSDQEGGLVYAVRDGTTWNLERTEIDYPTHYALKLLIDPTNDKPLLFMEDLGADQLVVFRGQ